MIGFFVDGTPKAKGSMTGFLRNGHVVVTAGHHSAKWEKTIVEHLATKDFELIPGPVFLALRFRMPIPESRRPKPKSADVWKRVPVPAVFPDLDKLVRAVMDAITKAGLYEDDARVIDLVASARYTVSRPGVGVTLAQSNPVAIAKEDVS